MFAADSKAVHAPPSSSLNTVIAQSWKQIIDPVEPFLEAVGMRLSQEVNAFDSQIAHYAEYAINGQGKHLRPGLVALTANALGKATDSHVTVAVIIEMVHLATLVHDDVMDEAEIRRSRLTLAANWGNEIAVLFGDCLFAHALKLAAGFPTPEICRAVASATNTVCAGEIIQTQHRRDFGFTREKYFKVLEMKTAELFALSCDLSAFLSNSSAEIRQHLRQFGLAFGTAYQLYDDCVDLFGQEAIAGKSLGTDLAKGKLTLPILLVWERATSSERVLVQQWIQSWETDTLKPLGELLTKYDALGLAQQSIHFYLKRAGEYLRALPASRGRSGLAGLTDYLAHQTAALGIRA